MQRHRVGRSYRPSFKMDMTCRPPTSLALNPHVATRRRPRSHFVRHVLDGALSGDEPPRRSLGHRSLRVQPHRLQPPSERGRP